jgi:hypothetical protein
MPGPTYADLCDAMDAAGVEVRLGLEDGRLVLRLVDHHGLRSLSHLLATSPDREVAVLCCSLALCESLDGPLDAGRAMAREWPELAVLGRTCQNRAGGDDPSL